MSDRPATSEIERAARRELVELAHRMLDGSLTFFEGAHRVACLRHSIGGVQERDSDFDAFTVIESESDHLPLPAQRPLWADEALTALEPEFVRTEAWASDFGSLACTSLIARFAEG